MPISLNTTTVRSCNTAGNWTAVGNGGGIASSDFVQKEGTDCLDWNIDTAPSVSVDGYRTAISPTVNLTTRQLALWFLLPETNNAGADLLQSTSGALRIRVYSSQSGTERWADYYFGGTDPQANVPKGWVNLVVSGDAGTEDGNSGTWLTADAQAVDAMAILVLCAAVNNDKNDSGYGIDWLRHYDTITISQYNGGTTPWTLEDLYQESIENLGTDGDGDWGIVLKNDTYFEIGAAIQFGDGTNAGAFADANKFMYFRTSSDDVAADIDILNNMTVTLGTKDDNGASGVVWAVGGVQFVASNGVPDLIVASGGVFNNYAGLLRGWGTINLGSGGTGQVEFVKVDFDDNVNLELRSSGLSFQDIRVHFPPLAGGDASVLYVLPSKAQRYEIFLVTNGVEFRVNVPNVREYIAKDTTYDAVILEGVTVGLTDSEFDPAKLLRTAV